MWGLLQNGLCELYSEHHCGKLKMVVKRAHITCFSKAKTKGKQSEDGEKKIQLRKDKAQQVQIIWVQHGIPGTLWCPAMGRTITQSVSVAHKVRPKMSGFNLCWRDTRPSMFFAPNKNMELAEWEVGSANFSGDATYWNNSSKLCLKGAMSLLVPGSC